MGADLRLPSRAHKDAPLIPARPIRFNFEADLRRVYYWWQTGDWPMGNHLREQASKVKMVVSIMLIAERAFQTRQAYRHEMIYRALGGL